MYLSEIEIMGESGEYKRYSLSEKCGGIVSRDPFSVLSSVKSVFCMNGVEDYKGAYKAITVSYLGKRIICSDNTDHIWRDEMRRCAEDDDSCIFDFLNLPRIEDRFELYRSPETLMTRRQFERMTCGGAATNTFRSIMREVEREFPIDGTPKLSSFALRTPAPKETASDAAIKSYLFFLRTALFWDRFNLVRNPRHEGKPLIVLNAPKEIRKMRGISVKPDRQVMFIN